MRKQSEINYQCSELVSVLYEDRSRKTRSTIANLEEISSTSAVLLCDQRPQPGMPITLNAQGHDLYGTVESVEIDETLGCFTKVKFDQSSRWHGRWFVPEHFLALCASAQPVEHSPAAHPAKTFTLSKRSGS